MLREQRREGFNPPYASVVWLVAHWYQGQDFSTSKTEEHALRSGLQKFYLIEPEVEDSVGSLFQLSAMRFGLSTQHAGIDAGLCEFRGMA